MILPVGGAIVLTVIFQACGLANAFSVRDSDGIWRRSLSWEKRSNPGDVLRIPLTNNNDKSYSLAVRMGTPFQEVEMAVSLSQNHIAVATPETPGQSGFYNPSASQSFAEGDETTSITGLDSQPVDVRFSRESCQILDFSYNASLAITPPTAMANVYPEGTHGVLGYGVDAATGVPTDSTLLGVYLPPNITVAECGIELGRAADGSGGGVFTMGGRDPSAFTGDFTTMMVPAAATVSRPSWSIPVERVTAGNETILPTQGLASIDPYYPRITLPSESVTRLYSQVAQAAISPNNSNRYTVPCGTNMQLTMTFGGKDFTLDPRDAITQEGDTCFGTVEIGGGNIFKFGSPFLRNVYTTFGATFSDSGANFTVAFADKAQRSTASGTPSAAAAMTSPSTILSILISFLVVTSVSLIKA